MLYFIAVSVLLVACDPGMTIHQIEAAPGTSAPVTIKVKTEHPLIGNHWYAPTVAVTNNSDSAISISSVELSAKPTTYPNKPRHTESFPLVVTPGKTETLDIWFELSDNVKKTFLRHNAALLVHYQSRGRGETAEAFVVGAPLDTSAP